TFSPSGGVIRGGTNTDGMRAEGTDLYQRSLPSAEAGRYTSQQIVPLQREMELLRMTVDSTAFRAVMGRFATGVTVVATCDGSQRFGLTVNAFCSIPLAPPLVLVCAERTSRVHPLLLKGRVFAVSFLTEAQEHLSTCFSGDSDERFEDFCHASSHVE